MSRNKKGHTKPTEIGNGVTRGSVSKPRFTK